MNALRTAMVLTVSMTFMGPAHADDWPSGMSRVPELACDSPQIQAIVGDVLARSPGFELVDWTTRFRTNCAWRAKDGSEHLEVQILPTLEGDSSAQYREMIYGMLESAGEVRAGDARVAYPIWTRERTSGKDRRLSAMITVPGSQGFSVSARSVQSGAPFQGPGMKGVMDMAVELSALLPPKVQ